MLCLDISVAKFKFLCVWSTQILTAQHLNLSQNTTTLSAMAWLF